MSAETPGTVSTVRKLGPSAKLPTSAVLRSLSPEDRRLIRRRVTERAECVFDVTFEQPDCERTLKSAVGGEEQKSDRSDDSGLDLLAENPINLAGDEQHAFLWLNYCRFRVMRVLEAHAGARLSAAAVTELLRWEQAAARAREDIVRANVPLVLAMAKRARIARVDFSDLVSEGNLALMRAVDKFDCRRGYKFSTYACRAILKSFSRAAARAARYRGHFPTEFDPIMEKGDAMAQKRVDAEGECVAELRSILGENLADLTDVEAQVIRARFALEGTPEYNDGMRGKTLEQVGMMIGVTKERVRQIQNKALLKLRQLLEDGFLAY